MPGELFADRYLVERQLGRGGMGVVFAARHPILQQSVAIKLLQEDISDDETHRRRFVNEARASALIESEYVVRVLDVSTLANGQPYIVMEHLDGDDLGRVLAQRTRIPYREAVDYVSQALIAVSAAHLHSIIHRDLKPSNLFLADRRDRSQIIKVLDFGISKLKSDAGVTTTRDALLGSPSYISPEQARNTKDVDTRTDIWSIGIVLFELITGKRPFTGANVGQIIVSVLENDPPAMTSAELDVPSDLEAIIRKCLAKDLDGRYANVHELAIALAPFGGPTSQAAVERIAAMHEGGNAVGENAKRDRASNDEVKTITRPFVVEEDDAVARTVHHQESGLRSRAGLATSALIGALATMVLGLALFALYGRPPNAPSASSSTPPRPLPTPSAVVPTPTPTAAVIIEPATVTPVATPTPSQTPLPPPAPPKHVVVVPAASSAAPSPPPSVSSNADPITRVRTD